MPLVSVMGTSNVYHTHWTLGAALQPTHDGRGFKVVSLAVHHRVAHHLLGDRAQKPIWDLHALRENEEQQRSDNHREGGCSWHNKGSLTARPVCTFEEGRALPEAGMAKNTTYFIVKKTENQFVWKVKKKLFILARVGKMTEKGQKQDKESENHGPWMSKKRFSLYKKNYFLT